MTFRSAALAWLICVSGWLTVVTLATLPLETSVRGMSWLAVAFGVHVFWGHGGRLVTATGLYMLCVAVFVGVAGHVATGGAYRIDWWLLVAVTACLVTAILSWAIFIPDITPPDARPQAAELKVSSWGVMLALALLVAGLGIPRLWPDLGASPLTSSAAFVGVVLLAAAAWGRRARGLPLLPVVLTVVASGLFVAETFQGGGRLTLVGLALSIVLVVMPRWRGRGPKVMVLAMAGPALVVLANVRANIVATQRGLDVTGLESAVGPIIDMAKLMRYYHEGVIAPSLGDTFLVSAAAHVPREIWPSKPIGFGAELTPLLRPDLIGTNHSQLALFGGEWVWNFGWIGLLLWIPVAGFVLRWLDRQVVARVSTPVSTRSQMLGLVAVALAVGSLVDLYWGGTFTFMSRGGARLLVVFGLWVAFAASSRHAPGESLGRPARRARSGLLDVERGPGATVGAEVLRTDRR